MSDYTELKLAAEAASQGRWNQDGFDVQNDDIEDYRVFRCNLLADAKFIAAANPAAVLALIAETERLERLALDSVNAEYAGSMDLESICAERDQLKAENEALKGPHDWLAEDLIKELVDNAQAIQENADDGEEDPFVIVLLAAAQRIRRQEANIDQLRAEVAGLRTGYEAYERVNAELKADNEALRKDLESHKRMLLAAACDLGAIGEALKSDMDADGDELLGMVVDLKAQNTRMLEWLKDISRTSGDKGAVMGARQLLKEFAE